MGRELRRKENRKNKNQTNQNEKQLDVSIKVTTLIKLVVFVVIFLLILWYLVAMFVTKEMGFSKNEDNETSEQSNDTNNTVSNRILASNTFEQKEETYYVYYYDFTDEDKSITNEVGNNPNLTIYLVDTSSSLNKNYVTEESGNRNIKSISDLKVKSPTLLEIKNDKVTAYYEGRNAILDFLNK